MKQLNLRGNVEHSFQLKFINCVLAAILYFVFSFFILPNFLNCTSLNIHIEISSNRYTSVWHNKFHVLLREKTLAAQGNRRKT